MVGFRKDLYLPIALDIAKDKMQAHKGLFGKCMRGRQGQNQHAQRQTKLMQLHCMHTQPYKASHASFFSSTCQQCNSASKSSRQALIARRRESPPTALSRCRLQTASLPYFRLVSRRQYNITQKERDLGIRWRADSVAVREKLAQQGCQYAMDSLWSGSATLGGLVGSLRQRDVVDVCYLSICHQLGLNPVKLDTKATVRRLELYCDVSQNVNRSPWSRGHVRCATTSSRNYSFEMDRLMVPEEMLMAYGWPRPIAEAHTSVPDTAMDDLVGETMALQPLATVMLATIIAASSNEAQRLPSRMAGRMGA